MKTTGYLSILFLFAFVFNSSAQDCDCDYLITPTNYKIKYVREDIPGNVICIKGGVYERIWFENFHGTKENPIVIRNCDGQVVLKHENVTHGGFAFFNCSNVHFTGTGDSDVRYGFKVNNTITGSGVSVSSLSTDFEIDHVEISNTHFAGLIIKTDPVCNDPQTWRENFLMENVIVHDNYIHDTRGEGLYIGFTKFIKCDGDTIYGHALKNLKVFNNIVERTGWDGIQISNANEGCEIYGNTVQNYAVLNAGSHKHGLLMGGYTSGKVYGNYINHGAGPGITTFGFGDVDVYNNVIVEAGDHGIFCDDRSTIPGKGFHFMHNTIVKPGENGVRMYSYQSSGNVFYNNLIVEPGAYDAYENSGSWWGKGIDSYIYINRSKPIDFDSAGNCFVRYVKDAGFKNWQDGDFELTEGSTGVDKGAKVEKFGVNVDFASAKRPNGQYDAGAYEFYKETPPPVVEEEIVDEGISIFPNPLRSAEWLKMKLRLQEDSPISVLIYTLNGKLIDSVIENAPGTKGVSKLEHQLDEKMTRGVYLVVLRYNKGQQVKKLLVR